MIKMVKKSTTPPRKAIVEVHGHQYTCPVIEENGKVFVYIRGRVETSEVPESALTFNKDTGRYQVPVRITMTPLHSSKKKKNKR
jgi:hypothetical protein